MSKPRIMIVEDEFVVAKDIQKTLEKLGYEVPVIETTAKAAIEKAEEINPNLVLIDIVLKGKMDGIEAAEQMRSRFGIPVVFLTSYVDEKKLARAKKTEPYGYLIKPFKENELKSTVEIALFKSEIEMKLKGSEERYRTLIESTEDAVYLIDREMRFLYANGRYLTRHGLSLKGIEGLEYAKCHSTSRTKEFSKKVEQVFESNKSVIYEHESEKDRKIFLRTLSPVRDPRTGEINSIIVISKDITERRQAEEALRESEYFFRESQRAAFIGSFKVDFTTNFWKFSEVFIRIFGIDQNSSRSLQGWLDIVHPDDREMMDRYLREEVISKRIPFDKEYRIIRNSDGEIRWVHGLGDFDFDREGNLISMIGTIQDITERKRAEEEIKSLAKFPSENPNPVLRIDLKGRIIYSNKASDLLLNTFNCRSGDLLPEFMCRFNDEVISSLENKECEIECGERIFSFIYAPVIESGYVNLYARDITERKQVDAAINTLVESTMGSIGQEFFDRIAKSICEWLGTDCTIIGQLASDNTVKALSMYIDGKFIYDYSYLLEGTPCGNVAKKGFYFLPKGVCGLFPESRVLVELGAEGYVGTLLRNKDGLTSGVLCSISRKILDLPPRAEEVMAIIAARASAEIERTKAEEAQRKSETLYRLISGLVTSFAYSITVKSIGKYEPQWVSGEYEKVAGYTLEEVATSGGWESIVYPEDMPVVKARRARLLSGEPDISEFRIVTKKGKICWLRDYALPFWDDDHSHIVQIIGASQDITERKRAEEALRESEERYKNVIENIIKFVPEGLLVFSNKLNLFKKNKAIQDIVRNYSAKLDYTEEELMDIILEQVKGRIISGDHSDIRITRKKD